MLALQQFSGNEHDETEHALLDKSDARERNLHFNLYE